MGLATCDPCNEARASLGQEIVVLTCCSSALPARVPVGPCILCCVRANVTWWNFLSSVEGPNTVRLTGAVPAGLRSQSGAGDMLGCMMLHMFQAAWF